MVNTQGEGERFDFLNHCAWDGCRLADLVYPFFLFIVGAAIYFVFRKTNYELNRQVVKKVLKRGALIFLIGYWALLAIPGYTLEDNIVLTVDCLLFGDQHLFTGYGIYFDPEGLLSCIPAVANALLGFMTSALLLADHRKNGLPWRTAAASRTS